MSSVYKVFNTDPSLTTVNLIKTNLSNQQKKIPVKIILTEDQHDLMSEKCSQSTEDAVGNCSDKKYYPFSIIKSRKKEKKYLRKKFNTSTFRVHNMDCLLKKIKAKFLKYVFSKVKKICLENHIEIKKFDQCKEVRNLNVKHNRDNFINLKIYEVLINDCIISKNDCDILLSQSNIEIHNMLNMKIKNFFHFDFLRSSYFKNWLKDPIKIKNDISFNKLPSISDINNDVIQCNINNLTEFDDSKINQNSEKFLHHSKNIFKNNPDDYEKYKKLLLHTSCNFIFYFQNNPLKFGKKNY